MTLRLPPFLSVLAVLLALGGAFLAAGVVARACDPVEPVTPPNDGRAVLLAESLATALEKSREANRKLRDSVKALPPDVVVRWAVKRIMVRDTAWRMWPPDSVPPDTSELAQAREVIKKCEMDLSDAGVKIDSLEGENVQKDFDLAQAGDALATKPVKYWSGFRDGCGACGSAGLTVCLLTK